MDSMHDNGVPNYGTPLYRLQKLLASVGDSPTVFVTSGDVSDVCEWIGEDKVTAKIQEKLGSRMSDTTAMSVGDLKQLIAAAIKKQPAVEPLQEN